MANTYRSEQKVIVKEDGKGQPYLIFELLRGEEVPMLQSANIGLGLREGTTYEEAVTLARQINDKLSALFIAEF
ncbi:hypothetical protein [Vibrio cortegadensis]|uniref:Uncharacterized protein n=1 Tax=Vibrio cortegadensis TaxID=1328770 RepID=A0ABV4MC37_9VIBR